MKFDFETYMDKFINKDLYNDFLGRKEEEKKQMYF